MTVDPTILAAKRLAAAIKQEWRSYVELVAHAHPGTDVEDLAEALAAASGTSQTSVTRRLVAIRHALGERNLPAEKVIERGQEATLSDYERDRRARQYGKDAQLRFTVPASLRDVIQEDFRRLHAVLGVSSEGAWDFIHSLLVTMSDDDLKHAAGGT